MNLRKALSIAVCAMLMFAVVPALAQTPITSQTSVPLSFNVPSSVSINCTTPTFTVAGLTATSSTITCTENWDLPAGLGYGQGICVAQYFNTATPFGASGPDSSAVSAAVNGGSAVAFPSASGLIPSGGSSLPCSNTLGALLSAQYYGPLLNHGATEPIQGSNTDTDVITVNLTGLGATTYSGNLNFAMGAM